MRKLTMSSSSSFTPKLIPRFFCSATANLRLLQKIINNRESRKSQVEKEVALRARAAEEQQELEKHAQEKSAAAAAFDELKAVQDTLDMDLSELEGHQVLFVARPDEPSVDLDSEDAAAISRAANSLSFGEAFEGQKTAVFRTALASGFILQQAVQRGYVTASTMHAIFSLLAFSADVQLAGAAFRTIQAILGDNPGEFPNTEPSFAVIPFDSTKSVRVDPAIVPTAASILQALRANGYDPDRAVRHNSRDDGREKEVGDEIEKAVRVQSVKLLLHTAAVVCRHCARHLNAAPIALAPTAVADLILAVLHISLDPTSLRLGPDLDEALIALVGSLDVDAWERTAPNLANQIVQLGPSNHARLRLLRNLPADDMRGHRLRQICACSLVRRIIPEKEEKALNKKQKGNEDEAVYAVLTSQWWWNSGKRLVTEVSPIQEAAKRPGEVYSIVDVELLLHVVDMLLWPYALRATAAKAQGASQDEVRAAAGPLNRKNFVDGWLECLREISRNIKALKLEEQAVRSLANKLDNRYQDVID